MTPERAYLDRLRKDSARRAGLVSGKGLTVRARRSGSAIDQTQLTFRASRNLRVTAADVTAGLADSGDVGKFWFVPGYSIVGGPDVVRPE